MLKSFFSRRMLVIFFLGVGSGVPLGAIFSTLQAWLQDSGVSIKTIGLFALVQMPYSFKFLWAPVMDRYVPPFLGRRRGWILVTQICVMASLFSMSLINPGANASLVGCLAVLIAFFSASQDIVVDAYRRDLLVDSELGLGSAMAVNGYLVGYRYLGVALALVLADMMTWPHVFQILACLVLVGVGAVLLAENPKASVVPPQTIREAVVAPLLDYLKKPGAIEILFFILLYKLGDNMAMSLSTTFYKIVGFSNTEVGVLSKVVGFWAMFVGGFVGG